MIQRIASRYHARSATTTTTTTTTSTEDTNYHNDYNSNNNNNNNNNHNNNNNNNNNNRDDNQSNNYFYSTQTNINMIYNHKRLPTLNVRNRLEKEELSHSLILPRILSTIDKKREDNQKERTDNNNVDVDDGCQDYVVGRGRNKDRDVMICGIESSFAYILFA